MFVKCKACERQLYILDAILDAAQIDYRPTRRLHRVKFEAATIAKPTMQYVIRSLFCQTSAAGTEY